MIRSLFVALAAAVCAWPCWCWAQAPAITHCVPGGIAPGKTTDITVFGTNLAGVTASWAGFPGKFELAPGVKNNGKEKGKVVYRITVPPETPVGLAALRVATSKGLSPLKMILIDDLPSVADNGKNKSPSAAQPLTLPVAVDGTCEKESYDYFKFTAKAGQRVSAEVYAKRLASALDPVVRLLDERGTELAYSDDEGGIGDDCRLSHKFAADGTYFIEVRDITYQGSANHRYRLRVGDFPLVSTAFPLAVQRGTNATVRLAGAAAEGASPLKVSMPSDAVAMAAAARFPSGGAAAPVTVLASDVTEFVEKEPNDKPEAATAVTLPGGVNGRFEKPADRDCYRFEAKKGQRFIFAAGTRSLGSPSLLSLKIAKADGGVVAAAEDPITSEVSVTFTAPADGVYYLALSEWQRSHGPQYSYRIEARAYEPGFSLSLDAATLNVPKGGVFVAKVTAARVAYSGPITLELRGAGEGFTIAGNVIAAKKNDTTLRVTVPESLNPGAILPLEIWGTAKLGDKPFSARAGAIAAIRKEAPGLENPPGHVDDALALGVGGPFPAFFQLAMKPKLVEFPQAVGQATFKITAKRLNKFNDAIALSIAGLPKGFTAKVAPIAKGKGDAAITLTGPKDAAEGEHKITVQGSATFQNQPKTVELGEVALKIVKPLAVSLKLAGPITAGKKQKLKLQVVRRGGYQGEIALELKDLPDGVTAPAGIKIAGGKNEVEVELTAATDAKSGKSNLVAVAKAKINGQDISVQSPAVPLEVKPGK